MRLTFATTVACLANVTLSVKVKCYRIDKMSSVRLKPRALQVSSQAYGNVKRCSASLPKPRGASVFSTRSPRRRTNVYTGRQRRNFVRYLCQLISAAIL